MKLGLAVATVLIVAGCNTVPQGACRCPKPIAYDDATIKQITAALQALPQDNVLHRAMDDYEEERDALRICRRSRS